MAWPTELLLAVPLALLAWGLARAVRTSRVQKEQAARLDLLERRIDSVALTIDQLRPRPDPGQRSETERPDRRRVGADAALQRLELGQRGQPLRRGHVHPGHPRQRRALGPGGARPRVSFADEFAGARAYAGSATAETVLDVHRNGAPIGTITFGIGAAAGTFATTGGAETFAAGDRRAIVNEDPADATLAELSITFLGKRT